MKIHIKNHTKHMLFLAAMTAMITACDNEVPYEEGQATAADCMNVRFSPDNEMNFVFGEEDAAAADYSVELTLIREKTDADADVPVEIVSADECMKLETPVAHFNAGEETANIRISFEGIQKFVEKKCYIKIPDEYVNLYQEEPDGTGYSMVKVILSEWRKIIKDADVWGYKGYSGYYCDIYWLVGLNRFRFTNFMESGLDVTFRIDGGNFNADVPSTWNGYLTPLDNFEVRDDASTSGGTEPHLYWYLYDDVKGERPVYYLASGRLVNGNLCFHATTYYCECNLIDGGVSGYDECHLLMYKYNGGTEWVEFDYESDQINLDGFDDEPEAKSEN